ncbi:hypothetical protein UFOVP1264_81 [uncultured Caudovirales phage]|uniref:Uncharacterized protein n=1 Tax=uncultured Caudovirales phage TaxID=2100421 RepID=A0A6J5RJX0_9CAUD|nr:hypothetical protein UFOVP1264_81 [uncultured Caudovirales phage]
MLGVATTEVIGRFLDLIKGQETYLSLHTDYPSAIDPTATEISSAVSSSYQRARVTWSDATTALINYNDLNFNNIGSCTIKYIGIFDAYQNGYLLFKIPLDDPIVIITQGSYSIPSGTLSISFGSAGVAVVQEITSIDGGVPGTLFDSENIIDAGSSF